MSDEFVTRAVHCPVCRLEFTHDQPVPGARSGKDSDLRPRYIGRDPVPAQVLTCPGCRYSAYAEGFEEESELSEEERLLLADDLAERPRAHSEIPGDDEVGGLARMLKTAEYLQGLPPGEPYGATRYLLAARCHEYLNDDDLEGVTDLYLRASWAARATGETALEHRCQREALTRLRKRLDDKDAKWPAGERLRALWLVADLSRRVGDFSAALNTLGELKAAVDVEDEEGQRWLERARRLEALATVQSDVNAPWTDELGEDDAG